MTLKLIFIASLFDVQHQRDSMENKPASLIVVPLRKALGGIPNLGVVDRWPATPKSNICNAATLYNYRPYFF